MKIGIYMAYGPQTVLSKEGLGRYIGNLIKGFVTAGHQVTVACPKWSVDTIDDLFQEFQIDADALDFIVSNKVPVLWRLYERKYKKKHPRRKLRYKLFRSVSDLLQVIAVGMISVTSTVLFALIAVTAILLGLFLLPGLLLLVLLMYAAKFLKKIFHKGSMSVRGLIKKAVKNLIEFSSSRQKDLHSFLIAKRDSIVNMDLAEKVNLDDKKDVWFIPSIFWTEVKAINGLKVLCAPDLVTEDFPELFADVSGMVANTRKCQQVLRSEQYFVTYCRNTKIRLMLDRYGKKDSQVIVIPHINNDMHEYVTISENLNAKLNTEKDFSLAFSRSNLMCAKFRSSFANYQYICSLNMEETRYIFYASQMRPHKNILTLVKAYEYLLRKRYCNIKLILTGNILVWEPLRLYIKEKRLEYDVLSFLNLPAQELAAVYRCADLVVNPTLYEGGFPFTFGEGMSVGTPSVMSDIPQVREVVEPFGLCEEMLFDPYDWRAMADKIEYALKNRDALYQKELPLYRELEKRTGSVVAEEYVHAFEYFIEQDKLAQIS